MTESPVNRDPLVRHKSLLAGGVSPSRLIASCKTNPVGWQDSVRLLPVAASERTTEGIICSCASQRVERLNPTIEDSESRLGGITIEKANAGCAIHMICRRKLLSKVNGER